MAGKAKKKAEDIESYRHEAETRKNAVPVSLASYDTAKPKPLEKQITLPLKSLLNTKIEIRKFLESFMVK